MYDFICKMCNSHFNATFPTEIICPECKNRPCEVCGKNFKREWPYDQKVCSKECRQILRRDPERRARIEQAKKKNLLEKYGVDNVSKLPEVRKKISDNRKSEEFKEKVRKTSLEKYGVEHYRKDPGIQQKTKDTLIKHYGYDNASKVESIRKIISDKLKDPEIRARYSETCMKHYGVPFPCMNPEVRAKSEETCMRKYGVPYYIMTPEYRSAQATHQISLINKSIAEKLQQECDVVTEFEFKIERKLYDIHIVDSNIVIEVNPSYTHSDLPNHWCKGLPVNYHLEKSRVAEENGYRCIHIFDWDDVSKVISMLKSHCRIYARNCILVNIDEHEASMFIDANHLQGKTKGTKYAYGLYCNNELVQVMTFGKPRYNKNFEWELLRLCTKSGYNVVGGASRLFKKFIKEVNPESILSYCDRAKFTGQVYERLGMKLDHVSPPAKIWSKEDKYITDNLLRQRGFDQIFKTNYGKGTSNEELMIKDDWRSVYDCGQAVYTWRMED